ncbi:queuine tRNA-ribosyltransferase tRNA-guanine transglycosylase [Haladaptatus sp. AB618]|uniref:queuine tRNA-ribosyltransferase tRNA-guanine transglycosylase n=1 Tax=Haladaptatus sp. AB618 TaxID=2934173 RepID=UPI00209C09EE|nr:queuine tRNA-ribosyltransferase tRNA-guanine transglycosylase [Haladaptatus sp. AB618]MCO8256759.1 queuine tRNA-ribosyltransferase tRNA-guanine transglycosylase [Haladaptatus sp. AB618]
MRFYVPEWDDAVDADYDFDHDELSSLNRQERDLDYVWDIFDRQTTPIDGVLISREQVEETNRKAKRLKEYGVYDDPVLSVPEWLPTISDCGAWGYKSLPFPPYGNEEMLDFYEALEVSVGVTIDHLVSGSGKDEGLLYLDKRAFHSDFKQKDIPDSLTNVVDLMVDEWPEEWPSFVDEYEPSIRINSDEEVKPFAPEIFEGNADEVLTQLADDPRAVYREDDKQFRYDLTLRNAREMYDLYEDGDYPFRLMVAIQGWCPDAYTSAAEEVLDIGYNYLGLGGVAGSPIHDVRQIVSGVGKVVKTFERKNDTRVDSHVLGFAKTEAFETVGRSGMSSFDSASMLRSAWTGGQNYRLDADERYDAIRVRYPSTRDDLDESIEKSLRGRETLAALRAYAANEPIAEALQDWKAKANPVLEETRNYLREHRHDEQYNVSRLRDVESVFRADFEQARELQASFSANLRRRVVKLLRKDESEDPVDFAEYDDLLERAEHEFEKYPRMLPEVESTDEDSDVEAVDQIWTVVQEYATWIGDDDLLDEYYQTLKARPWEKCDCPICAEHGVEVCIFRGNDRNRRRGFHNTRRFYDEFARDLPKTLIATPGNATQGDYDTVEEYLREEHPTFWQHVHDLPVAEIGLIDADGFHEWCEETPDSVSFDADKMATNLADIAQRYQQAYIHTPSTELNDSVIDTVESVGCELQTFEQAEKLREGVLTSFGENYVVGWDFLPHPPQIDTKDGLDILVIDQCSGSKEVPEDSPIFEKDELDQFTKDELLSRENVPGIIARDLYTGRQQEYVKEAVQGLKAGGHNVSRYFVSAGFGLVREDEKLPPYEVTFSSMTANEIRERSEQLHIPQEMKLALNEISYDIVLFTLGKDYYTSIDIDEIVTEIPADRIGVVFNRELVGEQFDNVISISARNEDAKTHGTIVIGLKGLYLKNFAQRINSVDQLKPRTIEQLCQRVQGESTQAVLGDYQ